MTPCPAAASNATVPAAKPTAGGLSQQVRGTATPRHYIPTRGSNEEKKRRRAADQVTVNWALQGAGACKSPKAYVVRRVTHVRVAVGLLGLLSEDAEIAVDEFLVRLLLNSSYFPSGTTSIQGSLHRRKLPHDMVPHDSQNEKSSRAV